MNLYFMRLPTKKAKEAVNYYQQLDHSVKPQTSLISRSLPVSCTALRMLAMDSLMRTIFSWCEKLAVSSRFFSIRSVFSFLRQPSNSFFIFSSCIFCSMGRQVSPFFQTFPAVSFRVSISLRRAWFQFSLSFFPSESFLSNYYFSCSCFSIVYSFFFVSPLSSLMALAEGIFFSVLFYCFISVISSVSSRRSPSCSVRSLLSLSSMFFSCDCSSRLWRSSAYVLDFSSPIYASLPAICFSNYSVSRACSLYLSYSARSFQRADFSYCSEPAKICFALS